MIRPVKLVFFGSDAFATPSLSALAAAGHDIVLVVTNPDRRKGRSKKLIPTPVKEEALRLGAPVYQPEGRPRRECRERITELGAELGVVVAYGQFLSKRVREAPSLGYSINLHGSLLPRWRGAAPVAAAILAGDVETGVSIQRVEKEMDSGPLLLSRTESIAADDTRGGLRDRLCTIGAQALVDAVATIAAGAATFEPQDSAGITLATMLAKSDGASRVDENASDLARRIQAFSPWPCAFFELAGGRLQVLSAAIAEGEGEPGTVLATEGDALRIATGQGALDLLEVKPPGKRAMTGAAFSRGRRLAVGDLLA
jgi:methionyl-tRNA formyltransferase